MMKKKILIGMLMIVALMAASSIVAIANDIRVQLDGIYVDLEPAPIIVEGRTLLPARAIAEMLGGDVYWDNDLRQVHIYHGTTHILLTIDDATAYVNGEPIALDVPPQIVDDRTKVPVRFVAENMGVDVDFQYGTVIITSFATSPVGALVAPIDFILSDETTLTAFYTPVVRRNAEAVVFIPSVEPESVWYLSIRYAAGYGTAAGLGEQIAKENGIVEWNWRIGSNTTVGDWPVTITGNGETLRFYITIIEAQN